MKISSALVIHAFLPDVLSDYASNEICDDEDWDISYNVGILYVHYTRLIHTVWMMKIDYTSVSVDPENGDTNFILSYK